MTRPGVTALALAIALLAGCGDGAAASSGPRPQVHTISASDGQGPPRYIWHGTIDGRECIFIDDHGSANVTCDWGPR